jgi:hypothetical protein
MAGAAVATAGYEVVGFVCGGPRPDVCCGETFDNVVGLFSYVACRVECAAAINGGSTFCCAECTVIYKDSEAAPPAPTPAVRPAPQIIALDGQFSFTNSAYGVVLPIVFGSDKLPGNVFWSSGFKSNTFVQGATTYVYTTVSFAVGICEGEIQDVLRMWLGDKLIVDNTAVVDANGIMQPNADGLVIGATIDVTDPDSPLRSMGDGDRLTKIKIYNGSETQLPDPLMVSVEGYDNTPAYRGVAYVLFENFICGDSSIPALSVEVISNANPIAPRLYGSLGETANPFDVPDPFPGLCTYDPGYNVYYMSAMLNSNNNFMGIAAFDGNKLDYLGGNELRTSLGFITTNPTQGQYNLLPRSGRFLLRWNASGGSKCAIYDPFVGRILSELPSHTITHGFTTGNGANGYATVVKGACSFSYPGPNGLMVDVYCGLGGTGYDIGFSLIDGDGQIKRVGSIADPGLKGQWATMVVMQIGEATAAEHPTFFDGGSTLGTHIWIISTASNEASGAYVHRISLTDGGITAPTVSGLLTTLSVNEFDGLGKGHEFEWAMVDPVDNGIVMYVDGATRDWLAKFDPFTGEFVWKTPTHFPDGIYLQEAPTANLTTQQWAFVDFDSASMYKVDLSTGTETLIGTLSADLLPAVVTSGRNQFYNGADNSITYLSGNGNRDMVRVYLDRTSYASVPVSDIVRTLLRRVGVPPEKINVSDFTALTARGYTISEIKSLNTIFNELRQVYTFDVVESNGRIVFKTRGEAPIRTISHNALGADQDASWLMQRSENTFSPTRKLNLTYRDLDREYKQNVQSVFLPKYTGSKFDDDVAIDVTVPIVLIADEAKRLAEILLYAKVVSETTYEGRLPSWHIDLDPGDVINFEMPDEETVTVRLRDVQIGNDRSLEISAVSEDPDIYNDQTALFGVTGRYGKGQITAPSPRIDPVILSMPWRQTTGEITYDSYNMFVTFLNRRTTVLPVTDGIVARVNGTDNYLIPTPLNYPTWGIVVDALKPISYYYATDYESTLRVKLMSDTGAALTSAASKDALLASNLCNQAYVGGEIIQFETVVDEGDGVYLLTGIHRAKRGTDSAVFSHTVGENFILLSDALGVLDEGAISRISVPLGESPRKAVQIFMNTGNQNQPNPVSIFYGLNTRPWSVSGYYAEHDAGDVKIYWHRRSRFDGEWVDDGDFEIVPLNAEEERYEVYLYTDPTTFKESDPLTYLRRVEVTSEGYTYAAADHVTDGYDGDADYLFVLIRQLGAYNAPDIGTQSIFYLDPRSQVS